MKYGMIVELAEDIEQGPVTFTKGQHLAVAHYAHKYFVKLNTFGSDSNISDLLTVKFEDINRKLKVIGTMTPNIES